VDDEVVTEKEYVIYVGRLEEILTNQSHGKGNIGLGSYQASGN
jgi:hypothetical protein